MLFKCRLWFSRSGRGRAAIRHFQKLPKDSDAAGPRTPVGRAKVYNWLYHPLAFLMPWCSFSSEFEEKKKVCKRITKHVMGIIPKVTILSPLWSCMGICYQNTHRPSWYQYKQATLNFATAHNQQSNSLLCWLLRSPTGTHKCPSPPSPSFNTRELIPNGERHPKEHFFFFWKLIAPSLHTFVFHLHRYFSYFCFVV